MTRVRMLDPEDFSDEVRAAVGADELSSFDLGVMRIYAQTPSIAKGIAALSAALKVDRLLPDRLVELVRLRVAFFNQCRSCMAIRYGDAIDDGLTEGMVCSLERPEDASDLTEAERAAIRYGELMATDHLAVGDAMYDELRCHFTEEQIVELGVQVAFFVGFGRLAATWNMVEELPDRFQAEGVLTPWGGDAIVKRRLGGAAVDGPVDQA